MYGLAYMTLIRDITGFSSFLFFSKIIRQDGRKVLMRCDLCDREFVRPYITVLSSFYQNPFGRAYCSLSCHALTRARGLEFQSFVPNNKKSPATTELRRQAMLKISPELKCSQCGCDVFEALEINHKNGGGGREYKKVKHVKFYLRIIKGIRPVDDLDLRCKVCNAVHFLALNGIEGYVVQFRPTVAPIVPASGQGLGGTIITSE